MSLLGWIYNVDEEVERGRELDRKLIELNARKRDAGLITEEENFKRSERLRQSTGSPDLFHDQVETEFASGLAEGYNNVTGAVKSTLAAPFKFTFASIPWQLWLAGGIALAWYLGLLGKLKGAFK